MHDVTYDAIIASNCDYFENTLYYAVLFLRKAIRVDFVVYKFVWIQSATFISAYRTYTSLQKLLTSFNDLISVGPNQSRQSTHVAMSTPFLKVEWLTRITNDGLEKVRMKYPRQESRS